MVTEFTDLPLRSYRAVSLLPLCGPALCLDSPSLSPALILTLTTHASNYGLSNPLQPSIVLHLTGMVHGPRSLPTAVPLPHHLQ